MRIQESAHSCFRALKKVGVKFEPGLTAAEIKEIEEAYKFTFPPDLARFNSIGLPQGWSYWRDPKWSPGISAEMNWPYETIIEEVKAGYFWVDYWGKAPKNFAERVEIVRELFAQAPRLIPLFYSYCYLPCEPVEARNPVLYTCEDNIRYKAENLASFFQQKYKCFDPDTEPSTIYRYKTIPFWTDIIRDQCKKYVASFNEDYITLDYS